MGQGVEGGWVDRAALPPVLATAFDSLQLDQDTVAARQQAGGKRIEATYPPCPPVA